MAVAAAVAGAARGWLAGLTAAMLAPAGMAAAYACCRPPATWPASAGAMDGGGPVGLAADQATSAVRFLLPPLLLAPPPAPAPPPQLPEVPPGSGTCCCMLLLMAVAAGCLPLADSAADAFRQRLGLLHHPGGQCCRRCHGCRSRRVCGRLRRHRLACHPPLSGPLLPLLAPLPQPVPLVSQLPRLPLQLQLAAASSAAAATPAAAAAAAGAAVTAAGAAGAAAVGPASTCCSCGAADGSGGIACLGMQYVSWLRAFFFA